MMQCPCCIITNNILKMKVSCSVQKGHFAIFCIVSTLGVHLVYCNDNTILKKSLCCGRGEALAKIFWSKGGNLLKSKKKTVNFLLQWLHFMKPSDICHCIQHFSSTCSDSIFSVLHQFHEKICQL